MKFEHLPLLTNKIDFLFLSWFLFLQKYFFYYFFLINKKLNFFLFNKKLNFFLFNKNNSKTFFEKNKPHKFINFMNFKNQYYLKEIKKSTLFPKLTKNIETSKHFIQEPKFTFNSYKVRFFIFKLFFLFNHSFVNLHFVGNANFFFFSINVKGEKIYIINLKKFFSRWCVAYDFLINLNYFNIEKLTFASPFFKNLTMAVNWQTRKWDYDLWKYYFLFFLYQRPSYSKSISFFFRKLRIHGFYYAIVSDVVYHSKNIFYLKKIFYYTIGLITVNDNPFLLEYPLISFFDNYLIQSFFFKLLIFSQKQAFMLRYLFLKNLWKLSKVYYL